MKLRNVHLHGFGQFNRGLDVAFAPEGLNVVIGRNEAGKSTLLNAVVGIFFGFRDLNQARRFEPWDDHDAYAGDVVVETDDGRVLRFRRDFEKGSVEVVELRDDEELPLFSGSADPRGKSEEDYAYFKLLGDVLGFQDESVFRSTVFFGQQSLQTSVSDQIRRLISGSTEVDYKGALHELHSRYSELTTENPWRSKGRGRKRLIEETRADLEERKDEWSRGRDTLLRSLELEADVERLKEDLAAAEKGREDIRAELEVYDELHSLLGRREAAGQRYAEALQRRDNYRRYADRAQEIERRIQGSFSHLRNLPTDFPDLVRSFQSAQEEAEKEEARLAGEKKRLAGLKPEPNVGLGLTLLLVLSLGGLAAGAFTPLGVPAGLILGVVLGLAGLGIGRNIGTGYQQQKATIEARIDALDASLNKHKKLMNEVRSRTGSLLVGRSCDEVLGEYAGFQELREEKKRLSAAISALGGQEEITRAFDEATREKGAVDAGLERIADEHPEIPELEDRGRIAARLQELRSQAATVDGRTSEMRARLEEARVELAGLAARMDFDLASLQEDIRDREQRLERYDLERGALKEAIDTLDGCIKEFQESDVFRLSDEMSGIFSRITKEKYSRVNIGSSMEPVISRGDRVPISPSDLSQGAQDQLYFAMRVAMARHLSKKVRLPIFLDDPFVNFDEDRLSVTRDVLQHLDDQQVIMVTCDRDYGSWGGNVIDLDALKATTA